MATELPKPTLPILPDHGDVETQLAEPAAPYAPPIKRPLGPNNPLQPFSHRDYPAGIAQAQSIQVVRGARDQMAEGFFQEISDLSQWMKTDSTFSAAMEKRVLGLLRNDFHFIPASSSELDKRICDAVKRFWSDMCPEVELRLWVEWFHMLGLGIASVDWDKFVFDADRTWQIPVMRTRNHRWFYYDVYRSCFVDINADGMNTVDEVSGRYMVANVWRYGYFPSTSKAVTLGEDWIEKVFARRDWAEWSDFYSWPAWKATVPPGGLGDDQISFNFVAGLQQNVRNRTIVVERSAQGDGNAYDAEPMMMGEDWEGFPARIAMLDRKIQIAWLGGNLASEVADQGARAASETQQGAETRLIQSDNVLISQVLRNGIVRFFVTMNFGEDVACPDVGWDVGIEQDLRNRGSALKDFATFLKDTGQQVKINNLAEIGLRFGLQLSVAGASDDAELVDPEGDDQPPGDDPPKPQVAPKNNPSLSSRASTVPAPGNNVLKHRTIRKVGPSTWRIYSHKGKRLGDFGSLAEARKRLSQIEQFKHMKRSDLAEEDKQTYDVIATEGW